MKMTSLSPKGFRALLLVALAIGLSSCDGFLDLAPQSERDEATFYEDVSGFRTAVNGAYDALQQRGTYNRNYWILFEMRSDNTDQGPDVTGLAADLAAINTFEAVTTNQNIENAWTASYEGVQRCNKILANIEGVEMEQSLRDQFTGEALFIRSLLYYHIAVAWGNVPLVLESTNYPDVPAINQVGAGEVYSQIIDDLRRAEELLPQSYPSAQEGRATKGAAATLLGKVLLTEGNDGEAETALRRVVGNYDYRLLENYGDLWGTDRIENSAESVFEVQFQSGGLGEGSRLTNTFSPSSDLQTGEGLNENRPTLDMVQAYQDDRAGARFDPSMDTSYVDASGEMVEARYIEKYESEPFANFDAPANFIALRYADVLLMLAEAIGESPEAYELINQVRERVDLDPIGPDTPGSFEEKLLHERRTELAFENHRWADLKRFGQIEEVLDEEGVSDVNPLFPIPQRALDVSPEVLEQNPGY
jgi:hypothetical protein